MSAPEPERPDVLSGRRWPPWAKVAMWTVVLAFVYLVLANLLDWWPVR